MYYLLFLCRAICNKFSRGKLLNEKRSVTWHEEAVSMLYCCTLLSDILLKASLEGFLINLWDQLSNFMRLADRKIVMLRDTLARYYKDTMFICSAELNISNYIII